MSGGGTARVFVGLGLGAELGPRVAGLVRDALDGAGRRWRLPRAEGLHLTLCFLGDVPAEAVAPLGRELAAAVAEARGGRPGPRLALAGGGAFPERGPARVLWLGVEEAEPAARVGLVELRAAAVAAARAAGLDPGPDAERPFRAHVTVARPRGRGRRAPERFLALRPGLVWEPAAVTLFESRRQDAGPPEYLPRAEAPLG